MAFKMNRFIAIALLLLLGLFQPQSGQLGSASNSSTTSSSRRNLAT